jgi:hypothetical protein
MTNPLNTAIDKHFLTSDALKRAELLARHGRSSAEGWFKGEMIAVLDALAKDGTVASGRPLWLEVKTLVDPAKQAADIGFLGKGASFTDDLVKLLRAPDGDKAVLLFVLPRPSPDHWTELLATYQRRITPITFAEQSNIADYPPPLYVCKLTLKEMF